MEHYICVGGCGAVSDKPGVCQDIDCPNHGYSLVECNCIDGEHAGLTSACVNCGKLCKLEGECEMEPFREELES